MREEKHEGLSKSRAVDSFLIRNNPMTDDSRTTDINDFAQFRLSDLKGILSMEGKSFSAEEKLKLDIYEIFIKIFSKEKPLMLKDFINSLEKSIIISVLDKVQGNPKKVAKALGIPSAVLNKKIKKCHLHYSNKKTLA
ncbi:MAG: helix-turn-helix domain-containing protein [Candidatus Aminicenantales bacterium]